MTITTNRPADQLTAGPRGRAATGHDAPPIRPAVPTVTGAVTPVMTPPPGGHQTGHDARHDAPVTTVTASVETGRDAADGAARDATAVTGQGGRERVSGAPLYYLCAAVCTAVSLNTSWLFFSHVFVIPLGYGERYVVFGVMELFGLAFARGMRANVLAGKPPGAPRFWALVLCVVAAYMAISVSAVWLGVGRVVFGPAGALLALHLALGVHRQGRKGGRESAWRRLLHQWKQRALARLGADDDQDAAQIRRQLAVRRAASILTAPQPQRPWAQRRQERRLDRQLATADVAHRPDMMDMLKAELAVRRNRSDLYAFVPPSPWAPSPTPDAPAARPVAGNNAAARPAAPRHHSRHHRRQVAATSTTKAVITAPVPGATHDDNDGGNVRPIGTITPGVRAAMNTIQQWMDTRGTTTVPKVAEIEKDVNRDMGVKISHGIAVAARKHLTEDTEQTA